ncbi:MAG: 5-amino-6-(D-ribitylamino)uracil--L-tyrosine 4-hydroxyphenyl transferase CofH [Dehalococcoidia bacterium]|nr:5-amino-6-(D-ribitylamino)uracil--L-tyrosine 4-hydroxyphenyl transferase CofH [Dehalococcoidia bacterium]
MLLAGEDSRLAVKPGSRSNAIVTFSRSVTLTPTRACANRCGYCHFRRPADGILTVGEAEAILKRGLALGCREALIMSGERPWETTGFGMTEEQYIDHVYGLGLLALRLGLLPHTNIGILSRAQLSRLREVNVSMGLMLETSVIDLPAHRGGKDISKRIAHLEEAGSLRIPFTTGILIGIGESRDDRREALGIIRGLHNKYGHIQEVIVQNYAGDPTAGEDGFSDTEGEEMFWTVREAHRILRDIPVQVPPNLNPDLAPLLLAGARDLGGISAEADQINPGRLWPSMADLKERISGVGLVLKERLPVHPEVDADLLPAADTLRRELVGDVVAYVVNRNINFTNVCTGTCRFCAFRREAGSSDAYLFSVDEVLEKARAAAQAGATELCIQGGLHPDLGLEFYAGLLRALKLAFPDLHLHAFSPMEVFRMSLQSGNSLDYVLNVLRDNGLDSMPGTAAEILDDEVRRILCPDKLSSQQWKEVVTGAHRLGIRTTATMMFGHIETWQHRVNHLDMLRNIQKETGGFTELVLLPFTPGRTPLARRYHLGPVPLKEVLKVTAYSRLFLGRDLPNIQNSWVKIGVEGAMRSLGCGANDFGGTLMEENISRSAGADHGQYLTPRAIGEAIRLAGRIPRQRDTLYGPAGRESCIGAR